MSSPKPMCLAYWSPSYVSVQNWPAWYRRDVSRSINLGGWVIWWSPEHWGCFKPRSVDVGGRNGGKMDSIKPSVQKTTELWLLWSLVRKSFSGGLGEAGVYRRSWMDANLLCSLYNGQHCPQKAPLAPRLWRSIWNSPIQWCSDLLQGAASRGRAKGQSGGCGGGGWTLFHLYQF